MNRFINADIIILKKDEWYRNEYSYGANTPVNRVDESGTRSESIFDSIVQKLHQVVAQIKKAIARILITKGLSSVKSFSFVIGSYDRTYGLLGSF